MAKIPYGVISTVTQRNGEIYSGIGVLPMLGEGFIYRGERAKDDARDAAAYRRLCEISPLRSGSAGPSVEMTTEQRS